MGNNLKEFSNQEKAMVIIALRDKYPVKHILEVFDMAKSSYCYQQKQIKKENKIVKIKEQNKNPFFRKPQKIWIPPHSFAFKTRRHYNL